MPDHPSTARVLLTGLGVYHLETLFTKAEDIKPHFRLYSSGVSWVAFGGGAYIAGGFFGDPKDLKEKVTFVLLSSPSEGLGFLSLKIFQNDELKGIFAGGSAGFGVGKISDTGHFQYLDW